VTPASAGTLVVVDLSNLCRDARFLPSGVDADLRLLDQLVGGTSTLGLGHVTTYSVADRSLVHLLPEPQRREVKAMERAGSLEFTRVADERILEIAFESDSGELALVASLDNFDDFRRTFPIIQGNRDRFLKWDPNERGEMVVSRRVMGHHTHHRLSHKEESAELKARRLRRDTLVRQASERHYVCDNQSCLLAQLWPASIPDLPRYDDRLEAFVCPSCLSRLQPGELRPDAVQLIVFLNGEEVFRLLVNSGERITIGRRDADGCIGLQNRLPAHAADAVSRAHLAVEYTDGKVEVEDLGSRNGSILRSQGHETALQRGERVPMPARAVVALPGGVTLERSGRSIPLDGERPGSVGGTDDELRVTRLLVTRP